MTVQQQVDRLLKIAYDTVKGRTDVGVVRDQGLYDEMASVGLDPNDADTLIERMQDDGLVKVVNMGGTFMLTPEGRRAAERLKH